MADKYIKAADLLKAIPKAEPDAFENCRYCTCLDSEQIADIIESLPSVQPEIIRCKDCRWWDKTGDYDNGYCVAAKHGYWSEHWEISIRRKYKGDFYCADAEPKGEQE